MDNAAAGDDDAEYEQYVKRCEEENEDVRPAPGTAAAAQANNNDSEDEDEQLEKMTRELIGGLEVVDEDGPLASSKPTKVTKPKGKGKKAASGGGGGGKPKSAAALAKAAAKAALAEDAPFVAELPPLEPVPRPQAIQTGNLESDLAEAQDWAKQYAAYIERILTHPDYITEVRSRRFSAQCADALRQAVATVMRLQRRYEETHRVLVAHAWHGHHLNTFGARKGVVAMEPFTN